VLGTFFGYKSARTSNFRAELNRTNPPLPPPKKKCPDILGTSSCGAAACCVCRPRAIYFNSSAPFAASDNKRHQFRRRHGHSTCFRPGRPSQLEVTAGRRRDGAAVQRRDAATRPPPHCVTQRAAAAAVPFHSTRRL